MNTERMERAFQMMTAKQECFQKRMRRYVRDGKKENLEDALRRLASIKDAISDMEKEISAELKGVRV